MSIPFVYILLLNWNGWADTVECLESIFKSDYDNFRVIICDNDSMDHSCDHIKAWAEGRLDVFVQRDSCFHSYSLSPAAKPIPYVAYTRTTAEEGGQPEDTHAKIIIVQTGGNLGFAGGNNVGLRYALSRNDFDYVWLLNNDTVIDRSALSCLVKGTRENPRFGICGSTLLYYGKPDHVQALCGGTVNKFWGTSKHLFEDTRFELPVNRYEVLAKVDYVSGASMFVSKEFLTSIGLLNEEYFLYYEEIDWCTRGRSQFDLQYCPESIVYHKEGASIGSSCDTTLTSNTADYYSIRSRLLFTKRHHPIFLLFVVLRTIGAFVTRLKRKDFIKARQVAKILSDFTVR